MFGVTSNPIHKRKNSSSSQDEIEENTAKRATSNSSGNSGVSASNTNLSENVAPSTSSGSIFQMKPSLIQPQSASNALKIDSKQPKQQIVDDKKNPFFKHFKTSTDTETTAKSMSFF